MTPQNKQASATSDREIVIERVYNAPQELVFKAWTTPEHLGKWWGPNGFSTTTHEMEFKPGGMWRYMMHGPDGTDYPNRITYKEIVPPERIAYDHGTDEDPKMFFSTATFTRQADGKTHLELRMVFPTVQACEEVKKNYGAVEGGKQTLARLAEYVEQQ